MCQDAWPRGGAGYVFHSGFICAGQPRHVTSRRPLAGQNNETVTEGFSRGGSAMRWTEFVLGAALCGTVAVAVSGQGDALSGMADAERAFARMSVTVGQREAFIAFFAEEGVVFNPGPVNAREFYGKRPRTPKPPVRVLDWEPAAADVALSGDLGFSTGLFVMQEAASGKRLAGGWFFSIWKRQASGDWRVLVDLGVPSEDVVPLRPRPVERVTPPGVQEGPVAAFETSLEAVRRLDAALAERARQGDVAAYLEHVTERTRVYRPARAPAVGREAIRALLEKDARSSCRPVDAGISAAGDFAYVYGTFEATPAGASAPQPGGFTRVWRRVKGAWVLAAEVLS
ncbi:MAG: nuclear transport factor 2 family protein [Acidobacteria bacterium]|nr:MAG: nuclear transport factor 2 family protein [Acidobacteriota bacterium]